MFPTMTLVWAILAVVAIKADAAELEGRTIVQFTESLQRAVSEICERRSGLSLDSIDPLALGTLTTKTGDFAINNKNTNLTGLSKATLVNLKWLEENRGSVQVSANVTVTSDYDASGKFLFLPMSNSGKATVNLYDLTVEVTFTFQKVLKNSVEYMVIDDLKSVFKIGLIQFNMKSDGNCSPADTLVNAALNANWRLFESTAAAQIAPVIDAKIKDKLNDFVRNIPFYQLITFSQ